jgi:NAD(P) transhydrogenase
MTASTFGHSVALVDKQQNIGGAGINTGTVPSKTLRETALALSGLRSRNLYGVDLSLRREVTVADFLGHEEHVKEAFHTGITDRLKTLNAEIFSGTGSFVDAPTIRVELNLRDGEIDTSRLEGEIHFRGEKILIATGSLPVRPDIFEYACTFSALGAEVHIVDGREVLLPFLDAEVSRALMGACQRNGIVFHWNERVQKCIPLESDGVRLELSSGAILTANAVLVAAGRQSNTAHLALEKAGVKTGARGLVHVNEHFQTNIEHIYAAGDAIGFRRSPRRAWSRPGGRRSTPSTLPEGRFPLSYLRHLHNS